MFVKGSLRQRKRKSNVNAFDFTLKFSQETEMTYRIRVFLSNFSSTWSGSIIDNTLKHGIPVLQEVAG